MPDPTIGHDQRKRIFGLVREIGWDDEMRRQMFTEWIGKPSISAQADNPVTRAEAITLLVHLRSAVETLRADRRHAKKRQRQGVPHGKPTLEQMGYVNVLVDEAWGRDLDGFASWVKKQFGWKFVPRLARASDILLSLNRKQRTSLIYRLEQLRADGWISSLHPSRAGRDPR